MLNNPTSFGAIINNGSYVGDNGAHKAIAHGLGKKPKLVIITIAPVASTEGDSVFLIPPQPTNRMFALIGGVNSITGPTEPDSTNFYVGDGVNHALSANLLDKTYNWVAIA